MINQFEGNTFKGISVDQVIDCTLTGLRKYSERTNGAVTFPELIRVPDFQHDSTKGYSLSWRTPVVHQGEEVGNAAVILFNWRDGTGSEQDYPLEDSMHSAAYPLQPELVPRNKDRLDSEANLTLATLFPATEGIPPVMYAGNLELVSFRDGRLARLAYLGQDLIKLSEAIGAGKPAEPTVTYTTWHRPDGVQEGTPHAVYNPLVCAQLGAFIAVPMEMAARHGDMLTQLGASQPRLLFVPSRQIDPPTRP